MVLCLQITSMKTIVHAAAVFSWLESAINQIKLFTSIQLEMALDIYVFINSHEVNIGKAYPQQLNIEQT
jgi:hypothetical protein